MNISKILRRVLLEDDEKKQARGNDQAGQYDLLNGVIQNCPTLNLTGRPIRFLKGNELNAFTDLKNTGVDPVYYVSQQYNDLMYIIFGVLDPSVKEPALFAYSLKIAGAHLPGTGWLEDLISAGAAALSAAVPVLAPFISILTSIASFILLFIKIWAIITVLINIIIPLYKEFSNKIKTDTKSTAKSTTKPSAARQRYLNRKTKPR